MSRWMQSLAAVGGVVTGVWLGTTGVLAAGNPDRQPVPSPPDITIVCPQGFSATAHAAVNGEYIKTFTSPDGTVRLGINGREVATVIGNGKTLTLNTSGPATILPDGSAVFRGATFYIPPDLSGFWVYYGRLVVDLNTGLVVAHEGTVVDVCALLAG